MFHEFSQGIDCPIFRTNKIGHGKNNIAIQIGGEVTIEKGEHYQLNLEYQV